MKNESLLSKRTPHQLRDELLELELSKRFGQNVCFGSSEALEKAGFFLIVG